MDTITILILLVGFLIFISYIFPDTLETFIPDRIIQFKSGKYELNNSSQMNGTPITITFDKPYDIKKEYKQPNNLPHVFLTTTSDSSYSASITNVTLTNFTVKITRLPAKYNTTDCNTNSSKNSINWISFIVDKGS